METLKFQRRIKVKVKDLRRIYTGRFYLFISYQVIIASTTDQYDDYEIAELYIGGDDDSLDVVLKES